KTSTSYISTHSLHDALPILHFRIGESARQIALKNGHTNVKGVSPEFDFIHDDLLLGIVYFHDIAPFPFLGECKIKGQGPGFRYLDRKSTRLNSSHVKISYAV